MNRKKELVGAFAVRVLDPHRVCGVGTSVRHVYRVDETIGGLRRPHLVFFDKHGWYCEHGRDCPAVTHARKFNKKNNLSIGRHQQR